MRGLLSRYGVCAAYTCRPHLPAQSRMINRFMGVINRFTGKGLA
jgi:hypothetical protein